MVWFSSKNNFWFSFGFLGNLAWDSGQCVSFGGGVVDVYVHWSVSRLVRLLVVV